MAKIKKKKVEEEVVNVAPIVSEETKKAIKKLSKDKKPKKEKEVEDIIPEEEVNIPDEILPEVNYSTKADSKTLGQTLDLVARTFNLTNDFIVTSFKDGVNDCSVTLANRHYQVTVKIMNKEDHF